jgi:hypothetical protein
MGVHFNRYLMWAFPTLLALTAVGIGVVSRGLAGPDPGRDRSLFRAAAAVAVGLGLLSTVRFGVLYGELAGEVYRRDVAAARWITRNLPPGVPIANLATSVEYLTGHRGLNLHGVTSPAFYGNTRVEREAGTFEALGRLAADERPAYLISSVSMQEGSPVFRELARQPPLFTTTAMTDELLIFGMRYDAAERNRSFYLPAIHDALRGLDEVDRLNVCDTRDEAAHDYAWRSRIGDLRLHGTARVESYRSGAAQGQTVIDAGRPIVGEESFRVRCAPGRDLTVVMRTAADVDAAVLRPEGSLRRTLQFAEAGIQVQVDGESAGRWSFRPREGWEEVAFRIPAALVKSERPQLRLAGRYGSFFFWFYQAAG